MDQRAAQAELLPHAAGQLLRLSIGKRRKSGALQQLGDPPLPFGTRLAEQPRKELYILGDAELRIKVFAQTLRHIGDVRAHRVAVCGVHHVPAEDIDASGLNLSRAGNDAQQRRLSDSIGPDEPGHAAGGEFDADRV